jgi:hypothetical protein
MSNFDINGQSIPTLLTDPRASLERAFIEAYLTSKGFTWQGLNTLPRKHARRLRIAASIYASCRLAEIEARSTLVDEMQSIFMS